MPLTAALGDVTAFRPKLVFLVDPKDGAPVDAALSPETREYLQNLTLSQRQAKARIMEVLDEPTDVSPVEQYHETDASLGINSGVSSETALGAAPLNELSEAYQKVEVPLRSDSEFFQMLRQELSSLDALQAHERDQLTGEVNSLAHDISKVADPSRSLKVSDLYAWRDIFDMYIESKIFFSTNERDGGSRNSTVAQTQLQLFTDKLHRQRSVKNLKRKESRIALGQFVRVNLDLLRNLKFQEINHTAMAKILKSKKPQDDASGTGS